MEFIRNSGIVLEMAGLLQAPRGARLYHHMLTENRLTEEITGDNADDSTNIIPKMGLELLREDYRSLITY